MLVWARVMAEMIMASCMGPESITLMMLVNSITTIIIIIIIIKSIKNSLCPWQSPEYLAPMGKKNKNHYRTNIRPTIKHGDPPVLTSSPSLLSSFGSQVSFFHYYRIQARSSL